MKFDLAAAARRVSPARTTVVLAWCAALTTGWHPASAAPAAAGRASQAVPARSKTMVDHAVVPAGGAACRHGCRIHGSPSGLHAGGHLADCRDGLCAPHCPVRPSEYGFYRTEWRRWPGQRVVPASAAEAAVPVAPPASQVPTAEEESPALPPDEAATPDAESDAATPAGSDLQPTPGQELEEALPTDPIPEQSDPAEPGADPAADDPPATPPATSDARLPVPPLPPGETALEPGSAESAERSAAPLPGPPRPVATGDLRYPASAGMDGWPISSVARQRPTDSVRGL